MSKAGTADMNTKQKQPDPINLQPMPMHQQHLLANNQMNLMQQSQMNSNVQTRKLISNQIHGPYG